MFKPTFSPDPRGIPQGFASRDATRLQSSYSLHVKFLSGVICRWIQLPPKSDLLHILHFCPRKSKHLLEWLQSGCSTTFTCVPCMCLHRKTDHSTIQNRYQLKANIMGFHLKFCKCKAGWQTCYCWMLFKPKNKLKITTTTAVSGIFFRNYQSAKQSVSGV